MKMLRSEDVPGTVTERSPYASRGPAVLAVALWSVSVWILIQFVIGWYLGLHWSMEVLLAPVVGMGLLLCLAGTRGAWRNMRGAWGVGNWVVAIGPEGVFVNTRPCCHGHRPATDFTVAYVPYSELSTARRIGEDFDIGSGQELRVSYSLELNLTHKDTEELRDAVQVETESGSVWPPVLVREPGVLHVAWCGSVVFAALGQHASTVDHGGASGAPNPTPMGGQVDSEAGVKQPAPV